MPDLNVLTWFYVVALGVLGATCVLGILHSVYDDTLLQRLSMIVVVFGVMGEINAVLMGHYTSNPRMLLVIGVALYGVATVLKRLKLR